jgi:glycosyltransferase involved in cell wall biosynthesis
MDLQTLKPDTWIIVDNSSDPDEDWSIAKNYPGVVYEQIKEKKTIGVLRNRCLELAIEAGAEYIVFWDDDDYYPPSRIATGVKALESHPEADIAGSSKMFMLLTRENVLMTTGPFGETHATAATFTIRKRYAETHKFPDKAKGEELVFTNNWKANLIQVPSEETIVVMGHSRNTVDKSDVYKRPHVYNAAVVNADNGKMIVRTKWPFPWDIFRTTFCV